MTPRTLTNLTVPIVIAAVLVAVAVAAEGSGSTRTASCVAFGGAVVLPGIDLKAGTYVFELADPSQANNIVRVLNEQRTKVYVTAYTRTIRRPPELPPSVIIVFVEGASGAPLPVKAWFPAGESIGHEFIYGP